MHFECIIALSIGLWYTVIQDYPLKKVHPLTPMNTHWKEISLGLFILSAAVLLAYMSITVGKVQFGDTLKVAALFDNASGIVKDAPVLMAGIEVGHVSGLEVKDRKALMHFVIEPNTQVYSDARAEIRSKSLLGEKYIALIPGTPGVPKLDDGQIITNTMTPVDLDEVLNHLSPVLTRLDPEDLNTLIHTIAVALDGKEEELSNILTGTSGLMKILNNNELEIVRTIKNLDALTGRANSLITRNGPALDQLIANLNAASRTLKNDAPLLIKNINLATDDVRGITSPFRESAPDLSRKISKIATDTAQFTDALSQHPDMVHNLNATLAELPPLLQKAPQTLDRLPVMLDQLNPLLNKAELAMDQLNPLLTEANKLINDEELKNTIKEISKDGVKVRIINGIELRLW